MANNPQFTPLSSNNTAKHLLYQPRVFVDGLNQRKRIIEAWHLVNLPVGDPSLAAVETLPKIGTPHPEPAFSGISVRAITLQQRINATEAIYLVEYGSPTFGGAATDGARSSTVTGSMMVPVWGLSELGDWEAKQGGLSIPVSYQYLTLVRYPHGPLTGMDVIESRTSEVQGFITTIYGIFYEFVGYSTFERLGERRRVEYRFRRDNGNAALPVGFRGIAHAVPARPPLHRYIVASRPSGATPPLIETVPLTELLVPSVAGPWGGARQPFELYYLPGLGQ